MRDAAARRVARQLVAHIAPAHRLRRHRFQHGGRARADAIDRDIRSKPQLIESLRREHRRERGKTLATVERDLALLAVLVTRRNAVADEPQRNAIGMAGEGILGKLEDVTLDGRAKALA